MAKNNSNARIRRLIAEILFEKGPMTRAEMSSLLFSTGETRALPSDSSLTAMLAKNLQIKQMGSDKVTTSQGERVKNVVYAIDEELIRTKEDLVFTRPYSTMTPSERRRAVRCPRCSQMRLIEDKWSTCLICERRGV